jgi:REP element-mobilizing transposase RayT
MSNHVHLLIETGYTPLSKSSRESTKAKSAIAFCRKESLISYAI